MPVASARTNGGEGTVAQIRDAGGTASFLRCDVARDAEVTALIETTISTYCSDAAGFTTGIGLPVDGGLTAC